MDDCLFCKIVNGEIPSYKIYEDDEFLAFLDIFPETEGYTVLIPKKHYRWVWDVENIGGLFESAQKIAKHFQKVSEQDAVYVTIMGEEVPHAHVRIYRGDDMKFNQAVHEVSLQTRPPQPMPESYLKDMQKKYKLP